MKDHILAAYLKRFSDEFGLSDLNEAEQFEHFVSYCAVSKHHPDSFDPEAVSAGGGGDLGLDGVAIIVNDHLVSCQEDVDYLKKMLRRLDVQFIFVQAKTSAHFDGGDMGTVCAGVRQFFERRLPSGTNQRIRQLHSLKEYVFASSIDMDRSPVCRVYYGTTGVWNDEAPLVARINQGVRDLEGSNLFSAVSFLPLDAEHLKQLYRELHNKIVREIVFEKHTILPQIAGVQEAYIGILPCTEYLRLICSDDDTLNRRLFYDNVRDFQGHNPVNMEIQATIQDSGKSDRFALLNNGVTVVAHDVNKVGARFKLIDYQIVNGCQTSHILFLNRDKLTPNVYLPIKLIVTADSEVTNQVTQGTNRQTEVLKEAFESLNPFQKKLEEFYLALGRGHADSLYYERRSKQYDTLAIRRDRIVSLPTQIMCFISMFLNEPQSTHRYYGELLSSYRVRIFSEAHSPFPYYISGLALATLERLFAAGVFPRAWKAWRFQLLMLYRLQNQPMDPPPLNSKAIEKYCEAMLEKLSDPKATEQAFRRAGKTIEAVLVNIGEMREPPERTKAFTSALVEAATHPEPQPISKATKGSSGVATTRMGDQEPTRVALGHAPASIQMRDQVATTSFTLGTVKVFSSVQGYGFITTDQGEDVFVHYSGIVGTGYRSLALGQRVKFALMEGERRKRAVDVERI